MKELNWSEIYEKESGKLLAIIRRYVSDLETAEDILHESFIKAIQSSHSFKNSGAFEGWLKQIAVNSAIDYIRKNKNQLHTSIDDVQIEDVQEESLLPTSSKNIILNASFSKDELLEIIDLLPHPHKAVFNMYVIDGFSHKQIADILKISETHSKTTLSRSRKRVQRLLHEHAVDKNNNSKKRKGIIGVLASVAAGEAFADTIFKNTFKGEFLVGKSGTNYSSAIQNSNSVIINSSIQIAKVASIAIVGSGIAAGVTIGIVHSNKNTDNNPTTSSPKTNLIDTINIAEDTTSLANIQESTISNSSDKKDSIQKSAIAKTPTSNIINNPLAINSQTTHKQDTTNFIAKNTLQDTSVTTNKKVVLKRKVYIQQ